MLETAETEKQRVKCPLCGLPVEMPKDWDGKDPNEALCNHCYAHTQGAEEIAKFGCKYLGNNLWNCGWQDGENHSEG